MNTLDKLLNVFDSPSNEITLSTDTIINAKAPIDRMINFKNTVPINKAS
jgi:quinolinate synthase